jgi:hypothetical protein
VTFPHPLMRPRPRAPLPLSIAQPRQEPQATAPPSPPAPAARPAPGPRPNRLQWRGRIAAPPRLATSPRGTLYCITRITQTTTDPFTRQPVPQAIDLVLFGPRAQAFCDMFREGDLVEAVGELQIRTDQRGVPRLRLVPTEDIALVSRES